MSVRLLLIQNFSIYRYWVTNCNITNFNLSLFPLRLIGKIHCNSSFFPIERFIFKKWACYLQNEHVIWLELISSFSLAIIQQSYGILCRLLELSGYQFLTLKTYRNYFSSSTLDKQISKYLKRKSEKDLT